MSINIQENQREYNFIRTLLWYVTFQRKLQPFNCRIKKKHFNKFLKKKNHKKSQKHVKGYQVLEAPH